MNVVEVSVANIEPPVWLPKLELFCRRVLEKFTLDNWELSVLLCDDAFIHDLNFRFRGKDEPTDVLSFAQGLAYDDWSFGGDESQIHAAGDIVISLDTLARNAEAFGVTREEELRRLLVHGILHLSGMDHENNEPDQEMLKFQEEALRGITEDKLF